MGGGGACASHFDVLNPMDKIVVTRKDDETVPETHRGLQVVPNTFYPKASKNTLETVRSYDWVGSLLGI